MWRGVVIWRNFKDLRWSKVSWSPSLCILPWSRRTCMSPNWLCMRILWKELYAFTTASEILDPLSKLNSEEVSVKMRDLQKSQRQGSRIFCPRALPLTTHCFVCKRGQVSIMHSDNGMSLVGAEHEMPKAIQQWNQSKIQDALMQKGIGLQWVFNPPAGSHFVWVWERQIRSARKILKCAKGANLCHVGLFGQESEPFYCPHWKKYIKKKRCCHYNNLLY